jgi:hypothetical protein
MIGVIPNDLHLLRPVTRFHDIGKGPNRKGRERCSAPERRNDPTPPKPFRHLILCSYLVRQERQPRIAVMELAMLDPLREQTRPVETGKSTVTPQVA